MKIMPLIKWYLLCKVQVRKCHYTWSNLPVSFDNVYG